MSSISSATASGELSRLGIRDPHIRGPVSYSPGKSVVGPALTLQFMPKREDLHAAGEYAGPERQLHRHVLYHTQPGDVVVVDACGNMASAQEQRCTQRDDADLLQGEGGVGVVIDGCIRDYPHAKELGLGLWAQRTTPNFHVQMDIVPLP